MSFFKSLEFTLTISILIGNITLNYQKSYDRIQCTIKSLIYTITLKISIFVLHLLFICRCFISNNDIVLQLETSGNYTSRHVNLMHYFIVTIINFIILFVCIYSRNFNRKLLNYLNWIDAMICEFLINNTNNVSLKYFDKNLRLHWIVAYIYSVATLINIHLICSYDIQSIDLYGMVNINWYRYNYK